jgi:hypothetical protein
MVKVTGSHGSPQLAGHRAGLLCTTVHPFQALAQLRRRTSYSCSAHPRLAGVTRTSSVPAVVAFTLVRSSAALHAPGAELHA